MKSNKLLGWDSEHPKSDLFDALWKDLVPSSGCAETVNGELVRVVGRFIHEYANNGNCNLLDMEWKECTYTCWDCGGSGWCEGYDGEECECDSCGGAGVCEDEEELDQDSICLSLYWDDLLNFVEQYVDDSQFRFFLEQSVVDDNGTVEVLFDQLEYDTYNTWSEKVLQFVINNPDQLLQDAYPQYFKKYTAKTLQD